MSEEKDTVQGSKYTNTEKEQLKNEISKLRAKGFRVEECCEIVNISDSTYRAWRKQDDNFAEKTDIRFSDLMPRCTDDGLEDALIAEAQTLKNYKKKVLLSEDGIVKVPPSVPTLTMWWKSKGSKYGVLSERQQIDLNDGRKDKDSEKLRDIAERVAAEYTDDNEDSHKAQERDIDSDSGEQAKTENTGSTAPSS